MKMCIQPETHKQNVTIFCHEIYILHISIKKHISYDAFEAGWM